MFAVLINAISQKLDEFGISPEVISAFLGGGRIDVARAQLRKAGGPRWKAFATDMEHFRSEYKNSSSGYILFKWFVAALTLLLPPRQFYQPRDRYGHCDLDRFRNILGKADLALTESCVRPPKSSATVDDGMPSRA